MIIRFLLIIVAFYFSLVAHALTISPDMLNSELKKNYSFKERSLNQSDLKIETSSGKILFDHAGVTINIVTPFEENYRIEGGNLEIHDVFLDQRQTIDIDEANNFFLNILMNGIDKNSEAYSINLINNATIEIIEANSSNSIRFSFVSNQLNLIRYKDSIGVEHGIELTPL
jgi:hypothetical protein